MIRDIFDQSQTLELHSNSRFTQKEPFGAVCHLGAGKDFTQSVIALNFNGIILWQDYINLLTL